MIYYKCSNGEKVSDAVCKTRLSKTYRELYEGNPHPTCKGCGARAQGTAHIIPKARAKQLGMSELIWSKDNLLPACHTCNGILENPQSLEFRKLYCYDYVITVLEKYDYERFTLSVDDPKAYTINKIINEL